MWLHPLQLPALWSRDSGLAAGAAADARGARVDAVREGGIVSCGAAAWREAGGGVQAAPAPLRTGLLQQPLNRLVDAIWLIDCSPATAGGCHDDYP